MVVRLPLTSNLKRVDASGNVLRTVKPALGRAAGGLTIISRGRTIFEVSFPGGVTCVRRSLEGTMTKWEYKCVSLDRIGTKEDFGYGWTYSPWEITLDAGKRALSAGLQELGRDGWELAGVVPSDLWSEGTRLPNASHGVRAIACVLIFKRALSEGA